MNLFEMMLGQTLENEVFAASIIARLAHVNQIWGSDSYYEGHVCKVVERMRDDDRADMNCMIIGFLMNAINETDLSLEDLGCLGFNPAVLEVLDVLKERKGEEYFQYIMRIADYPVCRFIKGLELEERLRKTSVKEGAYEKYTSALRALEGYNNELNFAESAEGQVPKPH